MIQTMKSSIAVYVVINDFLYLGILFSGTLNTDDSDSNNRHSSNKGEI